MWYRHSIILDSLPISAPTGFSCGFPHNSKWYLHLPWNSGPKLCSNLWFLYFHHMLGVGSRWCLLIILSIKCKFAPITDRPFSIWILANLWLLLLPLLPYASQSNSIDSAVLGTHIMFCLRAFSRAALSACGTLFLGIYLVHFIQVSAHVSH